MAKNLGLEVVGVTQARMANGQIVSVPTALAISAMEGELQHISVLITNGVPLAGISFLSKFSYTLMLNAKKKILSLEKT